MNILCLIDSLGSGGGQRQMVNLAVFWKQKGHHVSFVCYYHDNFYEYVLKENGIEIEWINGKNYFNRIMKVRAYIRKNDPDILISFLETPNFLACISSVGKHRWKLITNELSAKKTSFMGKKAVIYKWFERFSDATVCNSERAKEMWVRNCPQYADKLSVIYNPVMIPELFVADSEKTNTLEKRRIVIAASYQYLKNPIGVIEALHLMNSELREKITIDWFGRIEVETGNRKAYSEAVSLIKKYKLENTINLHAETKSIYTEMITADAVGLFSTVEGLPNAICEGMTLGKPIIMSRVSDYDVLVDKNNGILCDADNPETIAQALSQFADMTNEQLHFMGDCSMKKAKQLFSADKITEQWLKLMDELYRK